MPQHYSLFVVFMNFCSRFIQWPKHYLNTLTFMSVWQLVSDTVCAKNSRLSTFFFIKYMHACTIVTLLVVAVRKSDVHIYVIFCSALYLS